MTSAGWQVRFQSEIENAQSALAQGMEGRARVCARRAAGVVAEEYLRLAGDYVEGQSAIENLRILRSNRNLPPKTVEIIDHFLVRVNEEYRLPIDADLIQDAIQLKNILT